MRQRVSLYLNVSKLGCILVRKMTLLINQKVELFVC